MFLLPPAVECNPLAVPLNGSLIGKDTHYPSQVEFRCDEGFELEGSRHRRCQANRQWSGKQPQCEGMITITMLVIIGVGVNCGCCHNTDLVNRFFGTFRTLLGHLLVVRTS